jgi:broad specificity phosphatase PhoE
MIKTSIVIVTHGCPINIVYYLLQGLSWSNKTASFLTAATGIHEVSYLAGTWSIIVENDTRNLDQD